MIKKIDHIVITTAKPKECTAFYQKLGFTVKDAGGRFELFSGDFKINVHILGSELSPHAQNVMPGSADICLELSIPIEECKALLLRAGLEIELGIVPRNGVRGEMRSIYLRDPDANLVELCSYTVSP